MNETVEAQTSSERESRAIIRHGDDEKRPAIKSKEEGIVTITEAKTPPPDGCMRAWLVLVGVSLSDLVPDLPRRYPVWISAHTCLSFL